jgi:hypothetical protein
MVSLSKLSKGKLPGKDFKELNFQELCELFPQIKTCDVLLLDRVSLKLEPQKEIAILEINSELFKRKYTELYRCTLEEGIFSISLERGNKRS